MILYIFIPRLIGVCCKMLSTSFVLATTAVSSSDDIGLLDEDADKPTVWSSSMQFNLNFLHLVTQFGHIKFFLVRDLTPIGAYGTSRRFL